MHADAPDRLWWTADEIAAEALPDLPATKRGVNMVGERANWRGQAGRARRRAGRGGGWEYHWTLFPVRAQQALVAKRAAATAPVVTAPDRDAQWAAFEALPETVRGRAAQRLEAIRAVEALEVAGTSRDAAIRMIARERSVSPRSIWNWLAMIEGARCEDRLAWLAPRHRMGPRGARLAEVEPLFMDLLKADFLRLGQPSFSSAFRRAARIAAAQGIGVPTEQTARRRLNAEVSRPAQIYARKGLEALKRLYPPQKRDRRALHPMEAVNADYHKWDVFVRWPRFAGDNEGEVLRPQMVAFQDVYSGRILSWRLDRTPNKSSVALALGDMIERFGIPEHMLLDNGREFANKFLTGQAETRHRFKIKDDDIQGVLVTLGVQIHWATPYSGQSKPIERAFRDMCDAIAKDPRFEGAYTGNRPEAKPENYGARAIDLDAFLAVIAEGIEEHNARAGRRSDTARGRSFIETFDAAYAGAPIRKATAEQRRLWLMGAEGLRADRSTGLIRFMENEYWADWMHRIAGERVIARFDPADLWAGLHVYALDGRYLGEAECRAKAGFFDIEEGRSHARARRHWVSAEKAAAEAAKRFRAAELGQMLDAAAPPPAEPVEAKVVKPVFGQKPAASPDPQAEAAHAALVADFGAARAARGTVEDEGLERFRAALELEARLADGEAIRPQDRRWLERYRSQPEYLAYRQMMEIHGADTFG
ncbi:MAG: Mu transposase C-terminal domain-containing protein [Rhodobacteraceae bacterium]|nr:Mu transposase C-terminal domain-containing protein [Paracoccaceae bacterium]